MSAVRVLVADDQHIVRDGLVTVLSLLDDVEVVGAARTGREAVALAEQLRPDVVLMDLRMPDLDGAAATEQLRASCPTTAVLVLTTYADDVSIARALRAGARGYLTKDASRDDIAAAIRSVARGQATFDPTVAARLLDGLDLAAAGTARSDRPSRRPSDQASDHAADHASDQRGQGSEDRRLAELTPRERDVLRLIGQGRTNTEIADELFVSTSTVKTHINNLFAKLGLRDRAQAVRLAGRVFGS